MHTCIFYHVDFNLERPTAFHSRQSANEQWTYPLQYIFLGYTIYFQNFSLRPGESHSGKVSQLDVCCYKWFFYANNYFQTTETGAARASTDKPSESCETRLEQTCTLFNLRLQYISSGCLAYKRYSASGLNCRYLKPYIKLKLMGLAIRRNQKFWKKMNCRIFYDF